MKSFLMFIHRAALAVSIWFFLDFVAEFSMPLANGAALVMVSLGALYFAKDAK